MDANAKIEPRPWLVIAAFGVIYVVWGSTYLAIRVAMEGLPPFVMAGIRFLIAGAILFIAVRQRSTERLTWANWLWCGLIGTLLLVGGNGLVCWAEQYIASGLAALLVSTMPAWILILDWLLFSGPRPTGFVVLGLVLGLGGVVVLVGPAEVGGERIDWWGAMVGLMAPMFWSLGSLLSRRAKLPRLSLLSTSMQMLIGGAVFFLIASATGEWRQVKWDAMSTRSILALTYLILFGSLLALSAYNWLLKVCPASKVSTYAYVNPVIAVLLGALLAGETLSSRVVVATVLIVTSVVIIIRFKGRKPARSAGAALPVERPRIDAEVVEPAADSGAGSRKTGCCTTC